jgi:hypothetical protein
VVLVAAGGACHGCGRVSGGVISLRCLLAALCVLAVSGAPSSAAAPSARGTFQVEWESRLEPLAINVIHSWVLTVRTADGAPLEGAAITVSGGMPEHDHGLPTAPRVTRELGGGRYLVEGMKFHMSGRWEVTVAIAKGGQSDRITFEVEL